MSKEHEMDQLLNIKTTQRQKLPDYSTHYFPYEPTPYSALETLFEHYEVTSSDRFVDFGCGKGRLNFYIHHFFKSSVIGIEKDKSLYQDALDNYENHIKKNKVKQSAIQFNCCLAESYPIIPADNRFYFFNPFSIEIFRRVVQNILLSYEQYPRDVEILLYYPSESYIFFLENQTPLSLKQEVILENLYQKDPYERFVIYGFNY